MSPEPTVTDAILSKIVALLAPLFLDDCRGDMDIAQAATALASYNARNDHELRLAALIPAFGLDALDAVARAVNPGLTDHQVLRLHDKAKAEKAGKRQEAAARLVQRAKDRQLAKGQHAA